MSPPEPPLRPRPPASLGPGLQIERDIPVFAEFPADFAIGADMVKSHRAMDRDRRWDRTKKAWDAIVLGHGEISKLSPSAAVDRQYKEDKTDEFLPPLIF